MTTNLTEQEREVWKDAYKIHESAHDMRGTPADWEILAKTIVPIINSLDGSARRLAEKLLMAVYDYLSQEQAIREKAAGPQPEQISMLEEIPWS